MLKQTLRHHLRTSQPDKFIRQWVEPLAISLPNEKKYSPADGINNKFFQVVFPHHLFGQCFMMHARQIFENSLQQCFGSQAQIEYIFPNTPEIKKQFSFKLNQGNENKTTPFTFSTFIPGTDNYFALETAQGIARGNIEPTVFNPLSLCGPSGSGKSHLLHALAGELQKSNNLNVFLSTPKELSDLFRDIGSNYLTRQKILSHQAFILDDLQQIEHQTNLQDELVILFDHFFNQEKIVAFGCSKQPEELEGFIYPLRSRLQRGICIALKQPDLDIRTQFVRHKSKKYHIPFSQKQILSLATQFTSIRQLEGVINQISALSYAMGKRISERDFEKLVKKAGGVPLSEITSSRIIEICSEHLSVSAAAILGSQRTSTVVYARQLAMFLCRNLLNLSYPELGNIFGGKDQSTAMYSVKKIEKLNKVNKETHNLVTNLKAKCLGLKH